jgi:hypothetical protein
VPSSQKKDKKKAMKADSPRLKRHRYINFTRFSQNANPKREQTIPKTQRTRQPEILMGKHFELCKLLDLRTGKRASPSFPLEDMKRNAMHAVH